jgi:prepilin-type N-terminal cleavage/methylation domain-containing protein
MLTPFPRKKSRSAFTLVELLTVMVIIGILAALAAPTLHGINGNEVGRAIYSVSDTLDQARAYAMSRNTYVYVGVVQDTNSSAAGSMVLGVVASNQGTQMFSAGNPNLSSSSGSFSPINKLLRIENVHAASIPASSPTGGNPRQVVPNSYKLGDASFDPATPAYSFTVGPYRFTSAAGVSTAPGVSSAGMLQIDPQGVVSEVGGLSAPFFEMGLEPDYGNQANYAALQIAGVTGAVRIYRP